MEFEFDPAKSEANRRKHGIDFGEAQELWATFGIEGRLPWGPEPRWMRIGRLGGRCWSAIFTRRGNNIRLISVRRSRQNEVRSHDEAEREGHRSDRQP